MTTPKTDMPTLQERLRDKTQLSPIDGEKINHVMRRLGVERMEAADALDAHEATIAALVEALTDALDDIATSGEMYPSLNWTDQAIAALAKAAALK